MSGGSWNYAHEKLREIADGLEACPQMNRRALGAKMRLMAEAMHDIEWVDSCDYGRGADEKAIRAALGTEADALTLAAAADQLRQAIAVANLELALLAPTPKPESEK